MLNFLNIAKASLSELITQIDIAEMLGFVYDHEQCAQTKDIALSVKRQLLDLIKSNEN